MSKIQKYLKNHFNKNTIFKNKCFILITYFFLFFNSLTKISRLFAWTNVWAEYLFLEIRVKQIMYRTVLTK